MTDPTVKVMFTIEPTWTRPRLPLNRRIAAAWRALRAQSELRAETATFGGGGGGELARRNAHS